MNAGYERWPEDPSEGLWIKVRDSNWTNSPVKVADFVPGTYDSYARIFHPLDVVGRGTLRWSEVAAIEGTSIHPRIQLPELLRIDNSDVKSIRAKGVEGPYQRLPDGEWDVLGRILRRHTASRSFMIGVWEGSGVLPEAHKYQTPLELPHRRYFLVELTFDRWSTNSIIGRYPANLFWPKDRSWFVNVDIDAISTYVGGTADMIAEILECPDLETAEADLEDEVGLF
jgi:hypothetical protein